MPEAAWGSPEAGSGARRKARGRADDGLPTSIDIIRRNHGGSFPRLKDAVTPATGVSPIVLGYGIVLVLIGAWLTALCHNGSPVAIDDLPVLAAAPDGAGYVLPSSDEGGFVAVGVRRTSGGAARERPVLDESRGGQAPPAGFGSKSIDDCWWVPRAGFGSTSLDDVTCVVRRPGVAMVVALAGPDVVDGDVVMLDKEGFPRHTTVSGLLLGLVPVALGVVCLVWAGVQLVVSLRQGRRYRADVVARSEAPSPASVETPGLTDPPVG